MDHRLLTAQEEQSLGRYIKLERIFNQQKKAISKQLNRIVSDEELCEMLNTTVEIMQNISELSTSAKRILITHNMKLIQAVACKCFKIT